MTNYYSPEKSIEREKEISSLLGRWILESESMNRLRGVSFLGALNIAAGVPEQNRFSRYEHSISVAYLTWLYCKNLGIKEEISLTTTLAALIHDITHLPFSHSAEAFLQIRNHGNRKEHTSALTEQKITKVLKDVFNSLPKLLQKESPEKLANRLCNLLKNRKERQKYHPYISDIFETPFCPDTFDGVNRAWYALNARDVKHRSFDLKISFHEPIDPTFLVHFISSTTHFPFVYKSEHPPSKGNLIFKFHNLMQILYNNVIYSDWQSSAMVMFARALEIAYLDSDRFTIGQEDADVVKKIKNNEDSAKIYDWIVRGQKINSLSKENPALYRLSLDVFDQTRKLKKSKEEIKETIESMVAEKLNIRKKFVFWYKYQPLLWSPENIQFIEFGRDGNLWSLKWKPSEGEPSRESEIEIYYTPLL